MRAILILLCCFVIGCEGGSGERRPRRDRRKNRDDTNIVQPVKAVGLGVAQQEQVKSRAQGMRQLAASVRDGTMKTVWDVNKTMKDADGKIRSKFDTDIGSRFEKDLSTSNDALPSNAADLFETYATELESILK